MSARAADGHEDLAPIHEFTQLVIASTRSPRQRDRLQRALGLPLSETNLGALRLIQRHGPIAVTEIGRRLEIDQSGASRLARSLEEQGLVTRAADLDDRRVARLAITEAGDGLLTRARALALHDYSVALEDWSGDDRRKLVELLGRFRAALLALEPDATGWTAPASERSPQVSTMAQ